MFERLIVLAFLGAFLVMLPSMIKQALGKDPCREAHGHDAIEACFAADDCEHGRTGGYTCAAAGEFTFSTSPGRALRYWKLGCKRGETASCDALKPDP